MSFFRSWLLSVVSAALGVSIAQALTPEGTVKKVGRLIGGVVLLLAAIRPLLGLDPGALAVTAASYFDAAAQTRQNGGEDVLKELIAGQCGAYIVDKGRALGADCAAIVEVSVDGAGWPVPWAAEVSGTWSEEQRRALSETITRDLAIPPERQTFREEGT